MKEKLKRISEQIKHKGMPHYGMKLRTFLNTDMANTVVQEYYSTAIGYHDYFTLQAAEQHMYEQQGRKDMKERMMQFLRQVDRAGSVSAAIQAYNEKKMPDRSQALITGSESSLQNLLNVYLPRFGINPVTIPTEMSIKNHLPNPMPKHLRI